MVDWRAGMRITAGRLEDEQPGPWQTIPLGSGYEASGLGRTPQFRLVGKMVALRGAIQRTDGAPLGSFIEFAFLPSEATPAQNQDIAIATDHAGAREFTACRLRITSGDLSIADQDPSGAPGYVTFDGVTFWLD